jgi:sugar phosphate isomerase/epimerase
MTDPLERLAIQSWCLRAWRKPDEVIARLAQLGIRHVELCGYHADPMDQGSAATLKQYLDAGLQITAFGVHTFTDSREQARRTVAFAKAAGALAISADFAPGGAFVAEQMAREFGIRVGVHNHGRRHKYGMDSALDVLFAEVPFIGLYLDTAWALDSGEDPVALVKKHRSRLVGLHLKDFVFDRAGKPVDVIVGSGNLDLDAVAQYLVETAWQGSVTIEYEGDVADPVPALHRCIEAVRSAFARARGRSAKTAST